jgi:hypothetical protein
MIGDAQFRFQFADGRRRCRLADVARDRRTAEVLFACQRDHVLQLANLDVPHHDATLGG